MRSLIKTAKELTAERDQVKTDFDYLIKGIEHPARRRSSTVKS